MESWSYVSVGNEAVTNDSVPPSDSSSVSKNSLMGSELNTPCRLGSNILVSDQVDIGNQSFRQSDIEALVIKRVPNDSIKDVLCSENHAMYPFISNPDKSFGEDESTSKLSSSAVESYGICNSSLIDLNVGRYANQRGGHSSKFSHGATILSSCESSTPPRRVRLPGVSLLTACCQVYGCNKDLSFSKDYHKRHKVCEGHSKAAKVIVNEVEQRFCQQCSRFHFLGEFDDGKRSCRKRLAGHNERRRKPQFDIHYGRTGKLLHLHAAFAGCTYQRTKLPMPSISYQGIRRGIFHPEKCVTDHRSKRLKLEDETQCNPLSAISTANANLQSRSVSTHYDFWKDVSSFPGNEGSTAAESIFSVTSARHPHDLEGLNSGSSPLFQDISLASDDDFNVFDTRSTIQGLPAMSESSRALSLLSSKSQESSIPLCGIHVALPLDVTGSSSTHYNINQASEKLIGVSSGASNELSSTENNLVEGSNLGWGSVLMPHSSDAANLDVSSRFYQGLCFINSKDHLSYEDGATIDLLHQSSQLQRVEHQRQSMHAFLPSRR